MFAKLINSLSKTRAVIGSAVLALVVTLVATGLQMYGVNMGRAFFSLAWLVVFLFFAASAIEANWPNRNKILLKTLLIFLTTGSIFGFSAALVEKWFVPLDSFAGVILPGDAPSVSNNCINTMEKRTNAKPNGIFLAGGNTVLARAFPHTILCLNGRKVLWLDRKDGTLLVNAEIFDENGIIIAEIKNNEFRVNKNNVFYSTRPDRSSLEIYDTRNNKVLDVTYLNNNTVRMTGTLRYGYSAIIRDDELLLPGGAKFMTSCSAYNGTDIAIGAKCEP